MGGDGEIALHAGKTAATPAEVGYLPEKIEQLDAHFLRLIEKKQLQCAGYLLARRGRIFAWKSMGRLSYRGDKGDFMVTVTERISPYEVFLELDVSALELNQFIKALQETSVIRDLSIQEPPIESIIKEIYRKGSEE